MFLYPIVRANGQILTFDIYHGQKTGNFKAKRKKTEFQILENFSQNFD